MNLGHIKEGMRVPNYRKLCALLEEPVEAGNSKKAQLRRWERYFAYLREKNAFIITEVYSTPKSSDDRRMKYAQNLIPILLNHLAHFGDGEHTFENWFVTLGMANETLFDEKAQDDVRTFSQLTPFQLQKLVYTVSTLCRRTLLNTLGALKKDQIINYAVNEYVVTGSVRRLATEEEQRQIQHCKDQAMTAVGAANMFAVQINPARRIQFYETLNQLYKTSYGWDRTYNLLEIVPVNSIEISRYADTNTLVARNELKNSINASVISLFRTECDKADKQMMEEWEHDLSYDGFKLDRMTAELLIHILQNEL